MQKNITISGIFWRTLALAAAIGFLFAPVMIKLARDWWTDENYSHGLLVPFVIGFIIWLEFGELRKKASDPQVVFGAVIIGTSLFLLFAGTLGAELFTQRVSLVLMFAGIAVYFFGSRVLQLLLVPFLLLLFAIPIPQIIFNKIAFPLQLWASQLAVWGIRLFEVASVRSGNVIEILPRGSQQVISLEVVEACSGIRSLMTLMTIALVLAYFTRERREAWTNGWKELFTSFDFWRTFTLVLMAIPIAIITNGGRVTATGVLTYHYGKRALDGLAHDAAGWVVYVSALILLIAVNFVIVKARKLIVNGFKNGEK